MVISDLVCWSVLVVLVLGVIVWYVRDSLKVNDVHQKHVLITGCDTGFGNLAARQLDQQGFRVIAACLTEAGASSLRSLASPGLKTVLLDVTDRDSVAGVVEEVRREVGERGLWGLVNNAGRSVPIGPNDWMQLEDFQKVMDVNLIGLINLTLQCLPLLKKAKGRVVNMASILGRLSLTGGGYCLSKWCVEAFSDGLRRDMEHFSMKVSIIEPGFFKTRVTDLNHIESDLKNRWDGLPADVRRSYGDSYLQNYLKAQAFSMNILCSEDLSKVTSCVQHALSAEYPRTRYGAGWDAKLFWIPLSYMPSCIADLVVSALLPTLTKS
ncbi:retinol dehydrogenase 1 [Astyanax mexicanus]|uniref:Retinol dehydrogenase 1 n=1 Tax=Astyanax mexicanus TaxID=7994 RepID=A0A3B1J5R4_ASTMX|nr:retinol dehydrogenase 1 [Astyanax mexicanus]